MNINIGKGAGKIKVQADVSLDKKQHHELPHHDTKPHPPPHHGLPPPEDVNIHDLMEELRSLQKQNEKLKEEKSTLEGTVSELNQKVNSLESDVAVHKQQIEQYETKLIEQVNENKKVMDQLKNRVDAPKIDVQIHQDSKVEAGDLRRNFEEKATKYNLTQDIESGHEDQIFSLVSSPNGEYVFSGSGDSTIRVWKDTNFSSSYSNHGSELNQSEKLSRYSEKMNRSSPSSFSLSKTLTGHANLITCLSSTFLNERDEQDLIVVSGSEDATLKMFHVETGECKFSSSLSDYVSGVSISSGDSAHENKLIASVSPNTKNIYIYNATNQTTAKDPIKTIQNESGTGILAVSFLSNSEKILILDYICSAEICYSSVKLYDVETSQLLASMKSKHLEEDFYYNNNIVMPSHNGNMIISSVSYDNNMIKIHDLRSCNLVHDILNFNNTSSNDIKLISSDGFFVSNSDNKLNIFDYYHDQLVSTINAPNDDLFSVVVASPFSNFIGGAQEVSNHLLFYN